MTQSASVLKLLTTSLATLVLLGAAWTFVGAQDQNKSGKGAAAPDPKAGDNRPYGDKIVSIYTKGSMTTMGATGHNLQDITVITKLGRPFLTGKGVDDGSWTRGLLVEVAWDEVSSVIVFDSLEEYNERIRESNEEQGGMGIIGGGNVLLPELP